MSENLDKLPPSDEDKNRKPERVRALSGGWGRVLISGPFPNSTPRKSRKRSRVRRKNGGDRDR